MPIHVVTDLRAEVPSHLKKVPIPQLSRSSAVLGTCVKGKVIKKYPLVSLEDDDYVLKTVIQEHEDQLSLPPGSTSINAILFGPLAKEFSKTVNQGDLVVMAGFVVGRSPTAQKDGLHPCNLQLAGVDACIYVYPPSSSTGSSTSTISAMTPVPSAETTKPKYTYVSLKDLKAGMIVNIYGVVTFFKQPFRTKGTDYCSTLKITDQSDIKLGCTIFSEKLEDHPQIYKIGDIVRLHRVKAQFFNGSINMVSTLGFSVVTFDGTVGSPMIPRTCSRSFHFSDEDRHTVERLRAWAASQSALPSMSSALLSSVRPRMYFDLTCQLLAKAVMDSSCTLLRVWDGTRCAEPLLNVSVEPEALEGSTAITGGRDNLVANVLAYDNHVEVARGLKPGSYLRIYNLHAISQSGDMPPGSGTGHLSFHLHGGTAYGRGIRVLPEDSPDLQELKRTLESLRSDPNDSSLVEVWSTPPEFFDSDPENIATELTCDHTLSFVPLACVKKATPPEGFHVRAQLRSYQPERLHQALKLHCPECRTLQDVPDEETVSVLFQEALRGTECSSEAWAHTRHLDSSDPGRKISLHLPSYGEKGNDELIFVEGATLEEVCRLSEGQRGMIPVKSSDRKLTLLDLSTPVLIHGSKRLYGCKRCSQVKWLEPEPEERGELNDRSIAEMLGVKLLQYVFLLKLELEDGSGSLDALLWKDAESFFCVPASDAAANQKMQDQIKQTMDRFCPPGGSLERPWLDLCLRSYTVEESGQQTVCYQIFNTVTRGADHSPQL